MRRAVLGVIVLSLLAPACSLGPRGDWKEAIAGASEAAADAGAARVVMRTNVEIIETNIRIDPKPLYSHLSGQADFGREVSHLLATHTKDRPGVAFDRLNVYFSRSKTSVGTSKKHWARYDFGREPSEDIDTNDRRDAVGAPTISPTLAVDLLAGVLTGSLKNLGTQKFGNVNTTRYTGRISQDAAIREERDEDRQEAIERLFDTMGVESDLFPAEVWLDGEGRPRLIRFIVEQHKDRVNIFKATFEWRFDAYGKAPAGRSVVLPAKANDTITSRRFTDFFSEAVRVAG